MNKYKVGDVVQLRSGGPRMTVIHESDGVYDCMWFDGRECLHREKYISEKILTEVKNEI